MYRLIPVRYFRGFVLPVLEHCSAVWCSAADTHIKLLDRVVSVAPFLTGGVFDCDISHRRFVAVLCMLYKIRCYQMHPLNGALPGPYVPVRVTLVALVAHRYTFCAASLQNRGVPQDFHSPRSQCPSGTILLTQYSMVRDRRVLRSGPMLFLLSWAVLSLL